MKFFLLYYLFIAAPTVASAQHFLRGKIVDANNKPINKANVYLHSTKQGFITDYDGSFGLSSQLLLDTVSIVRDGYEKLVTAVNTDTWANIVLSTAKEKSINNNLKLISFTKNSSKDAKHFPTVSDETYFQLIENDFNTTKEYPIAGYSLNVNKAAYSNVRRFINNQSPPPPDAVRVEEMVNYFNLGCTNQMQQELFNISSDLADCPWNTNNKLLLVKICAKKIDLDKVPAGNFVFLIDVSGSMDMPNRLPLVKEAFYLFVKHLRPTDKVSIVTYGGVVGTWLNTTQGSQKELINNRIELLEAAGDTPGESGIDLAYKIAKANFIPGGNNRVILATDGDFNVGQTSEKALDEMVSKYRESGIFLTCLGVGMGNYKDSKLQTLAKRGNGNYAYLDNLQEAEKVLVLELTETLYAIADNASVNIQFNDKYVQTYRLLGYDNKRDAIKLGNIDIDGGEIGSGSTSTAIFELSLKNDASQADIATVILHYNQTQPPFAKMQILKQNIPIALPNEASQNAKFAVAVALYGLKLKASPYINNATWGLVKATALASIDITIPMQNAFLNLVNKTIEIYEPIKKKKRKKEKI